MSKRKTKRKISEAQRSKRVIEIAKYLKKNGLLSKQTKLHGGRFVSRGVLKKVLELEYAELANYKAYKVPRAMLDRAREEGYQIANGRIIGSRDREWAKRLNEGIVSGVIPVQGGTIEAVRLPYDNLMDLMAGLQNGDLDRVKLSKEVFMFKLGDNWSYRAVGTSKDLFNYLMRYDSLNEALEGSPEEMASFMTALSLFRMRPEDSSAYAETREIRQARRRQQRRSNPTVQDRRSAADRYERRQRKLELMSPEEQAKRRERLAAYARKQRKKVKDTNPAKYMEEKQKAAARSKKSRDNKKG